MSPSDPINPISIKKTDPSHREALVSLTALLFIEEHHLLPKEKLVDAKNSLQALFLRTSGEETLLRKLIDILKTTQGISRSFAQIANILDAIRGSGIAVENKIAALRVMLEMSPPSPDENEAAIGPFISFSQSFSDKIVQYSRELEMYLQMKENEARHANVYRIARDARDRLKQRLTGGLANDTQGEVESRIKQEVISSFDFTEAEAHLRNAMREARAKEEEIKTLLADLKAMCQMAMNPAMREKDGDTAKSAAAYHDVFTGFAKGLKKFPRLLEIKDHVLELFKMYQHAYGMFSLDFQNLNRSLTTMLENPGAYFESKDEDRDMRAKRERLRRIEGLIPFLERTAEALADKELDSYPKFSRHVSDIISQGNAWEHIYEDLLRAKIHAEADISTRI